MRRSSVVPAVLLLLCLALLSGSAFAKEVWMAPTSANPPGNDGNSGLDSAHPVATLNRALNLSVAGDTIQMRAGTYPNGVYMEYKAGTSGAYITVRSYDGDYQANLDAAMQLPACSYIKFEGINFSVANAHCVNICGISTGYQQFDKAHHIEFRRCKFHERDTDGVNGGDEIIKCSQAEYLVFEDCEIYVDNGTYTNTSFAMDCVYVCYTTIRRMYTHDHSLGAIYTKGGSQYNVLEQSVLAGCRPTSYGAGVQTGDGTGLDFANPNCEWETEYYIVRNNVIRWGTRCAFFVSCVHGMYVYNNLLIDCGDGNQTPYPGIRPYVANWSANDPSMHMNGRAELIRVFNNIFDDTAGDMGPAFGQIAGTATDWQRGNNNYYNNGSAIPTSTLTVDGVLLDPSTEPGKTIGNPDLNNATGTATTRQGWVDLFRPKWTTQSNNMLKDKGSSTAGNTPYPSVTNDIEGSPRPSNGSWDIGPFEYQSAGSPPVANFSGNPTTTTPSTTIYFTDTSTNTPTAWSWTFGDSTTSTAQNPSHSYTAVGTYTVALTATNQYGNNTNTKNNYITVGNKPVANFSGTPTLGAAPLAVTFTDSSTYSPTAWAWTFGDSGTSTVQNPSHTYSGAGSYTVALTAANAYGNNTNTKNNYVTVGNPPVTNFSGTPLSGNAPLAVSFTDSSTNSPTAWSWTFGDSNTSTVRNPSHTYSSTGNYTVALTATNQYGNNTNTKNNYITVTSSAPVANFSGTPTVGVPSLAVTFTDSSTNGPTAWSWTFGDGNTSTAQNPGHTYTASGNYTVALTATNAGGNNTMTKTNYITVCTEITLFPNNVTQFGWVGQGFTGSLADVRTDNQIYHITNSSASTQQDGRRYYYYGSYAPANVARLYVEYQWKGSRDDTPNYHINCLKPGDVPEALVADHLHGTTEAWDTWYTDTPANYLRADNSLYLDSCGCPVSGNTNNYTTYIDVARVRMWIKPGTTISLPTANFTGTPTAGGAPLSVTFTDSSTGSPTFWAWEFGDGASSTVQSPSHSYAANGTYSVTLTVNNGYGSHTFTRSSYINVGGAPVANFSGTPTIGAPTLNVSFTDSSTNTPTAWSWTFGDSNTSTVQNPSHSYTAVGNYTVALTATNAYGNNTNTKNNYITVGNKPVANFSGTPTIGAPTLAVTFTDSSTYTPTAWSWTFGDSNSSTVQNPSHSYTSVGNYTVALTATNVYGNNTNTKNNYITVGNPPVANFSGTPVSGNAPLAVTFTDSSTNSPIAWSWTFGDSNTSTVQNPSHTYNSTGNYTVALTATNAYGNNTNTKNNYITVTGGTPPVANFSGTPTVGVFPLAVTFTDSSTNSPTAWSWTFGDSSTSTAQNPSHTYNAAGNYTVALTATNAGGNNTMTKTNYIMACTEITLFPNTVTQFGWVGQGFTGSLADVRTDNQIYHITNSSASTQQDGRRYYYYGAYAGTSVARLYVEYQWKGTRDDTPNYHINCLKPGDVPEALIADHLHGTTEAWESWYTDTPANYLRADNSLYLDSCGCPVSGNTNNYTTYIDVARVRMWIKPGTSISLPTANFTGTPTTGGSPLAVTFTDSSTGSPAFWAWEFGDGTSSTVQSPSHTYSSAGAYTVSLVVNNTYGSNTLTRSNYITVTSTPSFVAAGAVASGTGAITPALPGSLATNDVLLLFLETANEAISITNQNGGTWTQVTNSPQGYGTAAASNATRITVFWSRYNGTQGAPTTSDSGNHQLGRMIAIRGATTSGDPCNITAGNTESTVDTSGAIAGATTTVANTLVVAAITTSLPDASGTANFSSWTNADLTSLTEQTDNTVTAGNGGGLGIATGVKASAGAYTTTAVTCGTATTKAMLSIAIKP